jgi:hypothetical protein
MSELILRRVVEEAKLEDEAPFHRAFSYTNDVWVGRTIAVRIGGRGTSERFWVGYLKRFPTRASCPQA